MIIIYFSTESRGKVSEWKDPAHDHSDALYPVLPSSAKYTPRSTSLLGYLGSVILYIVVTNKYSVIQSCACHVFRPYKEAWLPPLSEPFLI